LMPPKLFPYLIPAVSSGQAPLQILIRIAKAIPGSDSLISDLSRGLAHNVTTEMDLALWDASVFIKNSAPDRELFLEKEASELSTLYLDNQLPKISQNAVAHFLNLYGMRGQGEIDMGRPRWRENPVSIVQVLKSYLQIDESKSPRKMFENGALKSKEAADRLIQLLGKCKAGFIKARFARMLYKRISELGGLRELPKFLIIKIFDTFREIFLEWGGKLVTQGILEKQADIFFLRIAELRKIDSSRTIDIGLLISERKERYDREKKRVRIPRLLLSDGTVYYEGMKNVDAEGDRVLFGSPVSAGFAEGIVHVILDPSLEKLLAGEILVCSATDPGWTPLFLAAAGLIMEIGGMMTHGSVVAREYGIPAIVGVNQATTRFTTGQKIRMDGSSGRIEIVKL